MLGGGPAGATAALQARELGAEVTLVEAKRVGGTSLNQGPAPIRTLARAARLMRDTQSWGQFGLRGDAPQVGIAAALGSPCEQQPAGQLAAAWWPVRVTSGAVSGQSHQSCGELGRSRWRNQAAAGPGSRSRAPRSAQPQGGPL